MFGSSLFACRSAALSPVMPNSSAWIVAKIAQLTAWAQARVAVDDRRRERLLGEDVVEDHQRLRPRRIRGAEADELAGVARPAVASTLFEVGLERLDVGERLHVDTETTPLELGGDVALGRRPAGDADDGAVHVVDRGDPGVGSDHHPLAVVERRMQERDTFDAVPARCPGRVAHEHVELTGLQGGEPGVGLDIHELDLGAVAEHSSGDRPAEVGVEANVLAGLVEDVEPGEVAAHTTAHDVVGDHRVEQRLPRVGRRGWWFRGGPGDADPRGSTDC